MFLLLLISQVAVMATGISDAGLKAIFPRGEVVENKTLDVPGQGYFGTEIFVTIPYKEKISGADADYDVQFYFRRQILDFNRGQMEAIVEQKLAQFASGSYEYWGTPMGFEEAGSTSGTDGVGGFVSTTTIDSPQKTEVAGGIVWSQRSETVCEGCQQIYYTCRYAVRVGDFVATLDATVPDSRGQADEWFRKLINACK
ncbi:hypothetical protein SOV_50420 [Sporomusa ovata DSM 2662]|nr:hypothetical protein SOV_2c03110 [Sporomusa ovata DSM 2662]